MASLASSPNFSLLPRHLSLSLSLSLYIYIYSKLDYLPQNLFTMCAAFVFLLWNSFYVVKCSYYDDNFVIINGKCTGWRLKVKVIEVIKLRHLGMRNKLFCVCVCVFSNGFGHLQRRAVNARVRTSELIQVKNSGGRLRITLVVKQDISIKWVGFLDL